MENSQKPRDNYDMSDPSRESLHQISLFFMVLSAVLFTVLVALLGYFYLQRIDISRLQGSLLAETALQQRLMAETDQDHAVYPHVDPSLSFVLNPALATATWVAAEGASYRVNSFGLRGAEITAKKPDTKRVILVGDSVLFGWRLVASDMLESRLQALLDSRTARGRFEVVTIALPGWNTLDQDAFLRSHLAILDADYIVWSLLRNDILDTAAAVPPGVLLGWASPQKALQQPVHFSGDALSFPAPTLLERWKSNLDRIAVFSSEFEAPVSVLWWRETDRALIDTVMQANKFTLPVIHIPAALRFDRENWCVAADDCHPTRWANDRLALAVMNELATAGLVDASAFQAADLDVLEMFEAARAGRSTPRERQRYFRRLIESVGDSVTPASADNVLFGLDGSELQENGLMLLRRQGDNSDFYLNLESPAGRPGPAQTLSVTVRDGEAVLADRILTLSAGQGEYVIPIARSVGTLYEVAWQFGFSECRAPGRCYSARLIEAGIR